MMTGSIFYVGDDLILAHFLLGTETVELHTTPVFDIDYDQLKLEAYYEKPEAYGASVASCRSNPTEDCQILMKGTSMEGKRHAEKADVSCNNIDRIKRRNANKQRVIAPINSVTTREQGLQTRTSGGEIQVVTCKANKPGVRTGISLRSIATARLNR